jgi:hypothetical protein
MFANTGVSIAAGLAIAWLVPETRTARRGGGGEGGARKPAAASDLAVELTS